LRWLPGLYLIASLGPPGLAQEPDLTIEDVARQMIESERRLTDLELHYTVDVPRGAGERMLQTERYMRKLTAAGPRELHDYEYAIQKKGQDKRVVVSIVNSFDGRRAMRLDRIRNDHGQVTGLISAAESDRYPRFKAENMHQRVWSFGGPSYGDWILQDDSDLKVAGVSTLQGVDVVLLEGTIFNGGGGGHMRLWVAPSQGYLPLKVQLTQANESEPFTEIVLSDVQQVAPGIWYPRVVRAGKPGGDPAIDRDAFILFRADSISVQPLKDTEFQIDFPFGTWVTDRILGTAYTVIGGPKGGAASGNLDTITSNPWLWLGAAVGVITTILVVFALRRWRRRGTPLRG